MDGDKDNKNFIIFLILLVIVVIVGIIIWAAMDPEVVEPPVDDTTNDIINDVDDVNNGASANTINNNINGKPANI